MILDIGARIIASDGTTLVRELHDHAAGLDILAPISLPKFPPRRARTNWMHNQGDIPYGVITRGTGLLRLNVLVTATTWSPVETTWDAIEADLFAEPDYFIEIEMQGVTRRYQTDVPSFDESVDVDPADVAESSLAYELRFTCQPNPVTTFTP